MAVASGNCPSCGAPIEFGLGASMAKVCDFCRATVARTDRGFENLGKVADIAQVPSLIAVDDEGTIDGRHFRVLGRVQLDHGKGPWDEYYVAFDHGQSWGWLAYAEGHWLLTTKFEGVRVPPFESLRVERDVQLGSQRFRVTELKTANVVSAQGELPAAERPGTVRHYADLHGTDNAYATIDYGDNRGQFEIFTGWIVDERRIAVTQAGPRAQQQIKTEMLKCPACGGDVPKLTGDRTKRLGCPFCGAVSDIALQQVIAQQDEARAAPDIPIGSRGSLDGADYIVIAYVQRSAMFDGERFSWDEYLLFSHGIGYRWLVKDETTWMWAAPLNVADLDLSRMPGQVMWGRQGPFTYRNQQQARVDYVLGEVYWQVEVGETTHAMDFKHGKELLSREEGPGEVRWSYSRPMTWAVIAAALGLNPKGSGSHFVGASSSGDGGGRNPLGTVFALVIVGVIALIFFNALSSGVGTGGIVVFGGSSGYYGGK